MNYDYIFIVVLSCSSYESPEQLAYFTTKKGAYKYILKRKFNECLECQMSTPHRYVFGGAKKQKGAKYVSRENLTIKEQIIFN